MIATLSLGQSGLMNAGRSPFWSRVVLAVDCQGADGATTFVDRTGRHTVAASGNAQIDTGDSDFPTGAVLLDGVSDYLAVTGNTGDFNYGTDDVTIECWSKHSSFASAENFLVGNYSGGGSAGVQLYINGSGGAGASLAVRKGDSIVESRTFSLATNTLHHAAFVRRAGTCRLFSQGSKLGADISTMSGSLGTSAAVGIGSGYPTYPTLFETTGWIQWVRITKDSIYWDDFTPVRPARYI